MKDPTNRGQTHEIALNGSFGGVEYKYCNKTPRRWVNATRDPGMGNMVGDILSVPCVSFRLLCCFPL